MTGYHAYHAFHNPLKRRMFMFTISLVRIDWFIKTVVKTEETQTKHTQICVQDYCT